MDDAVMPHCQAERLGVKASIEILSEEILAEETLGIYAALNPAYCENV